MKKLIYLRNIIFISFTILSLSSSPIYANNINNTKKERTILLPPPGGPNVIQITLNRKVYGYGYYNVDGTVVVFDSSFTKALGPEDSQKLGNGGENIAIYDDGTQLSIDGLPNPKNGDSINIEMWQIDNDSSYKLIIDATQFTILSSGLKGYVLDRFLSKITPLNADSNVISFTPLTSNSATYLLRYTIFFNTPNIHLLNLNGCNQYLYKGITYTNSTILRDTVKSTKWGYDSIYNITNINITPITAITNNINLFGCNSYVYKGITYTTSKIVRDTLKSVQGCDSIYNVANISILPILAVTNNIQLSGCNSLVYKSLTYSVSSTVRDTIKSTQGCDSIYNIVNININKITPTNNTVNLINCDSIIYKGKVYKNSISFIDTIKSTVGCDSVFNSVNITIKNISITGNIIYPSTGKLIPNVSSLLTGTIIKNVISTGNYSFVCLPDGANETIRLYKNNDLIKTNGVSTLDVSLVQSHILQNKLLDNPYKIIASDVNGDGKTNILDIVYMKRLILGLDTTFTNKITGQKRLWAFIDSSYLFPDSTIPYKFKDSISYSGLSTFKPNQTFIGFKLGDVNWDWNPALPRPQANDISSVEFSYPSETYKTSEGYLHIPIKVKNFKDIQSLQFTSYDAKDKGFYQKHIDMMYKGTGTRKLSLTVQLSDGADYEGGDLLLHYKNDPDVGFRNQGTATFFPSWMLHEVTPVTKGKRYSLVAWIQGPRFK